MPFHIDHKLPPKSLPHIWVFGSNKLGVHGKGAALVAKVHFDANDGVGSGPMGSCYAIPTKETPRKVMKLSHIQEYVDLFLNYARKHRELKFWVTRIGCGEAGYSDDQIAPMFKGAPDNCSFAQEWKEYL